MILKQIFKTLAGAQKRCAFENAHPLNPDQPARFYIRRFHANGIMAATPDLKKGDYYRLEKVAWKNQ
jgi:hypothetical protein